MKTRHLISALAAMIATTDAAPKGFNYDESKVPEFTLPDVLAGAKTAADWPASRAQIFAQFEAEMYGRAPAFDASDLKVERDLKDATILDGKATLSQPLLKFAKSEVRLLIIRPTDAKGPVPAFVGHNFNGNHTVHASKAIAMTTAWVPKEKDNKANPAKRGASASRWDVGQIIDAGFALVTTYCGEVDPDFDDGFKNGVHAAYDKPGPADWGSIAAWAWGLSRSLDYLETDPHIDAKRVAVIGHSRLGKTSLWAGASDPRFALVISNNSGCGGAALSKRRFGETVARINTSFPHWFSDHFLKYNDKEDTLPFDQHMLMALIAPRPLYVASAKEDQWADPHGEFLSAHGANPVYQLLGKEGLPAETMPAIDTPVHGTVGYHIRSGKHNVTSYDWTQYLAFAKKHFQS